MQIANYKVIVGCMRQARGLLLIVQCRFCSVHKRRRCVAGAQKRRRRRRLRPVHKRRQRRRCVASTQKRSAQNAGNAGVALPAHKNAAHKTPATPALKAGAQTPATQQKRRQHRRCRRGRTMTAGCTFCSMHGCMQYRLQDY